MLLSLFEMNLLRLIAFVLLAFLDKVQAQQVYVFLLIVHPPFAFFPLPCLFAFVPIVIVLRPLKSYRFRFSCMITLHIVIVFFSLLIYTNNRKKSFIIKLF